MAAIDELARAGSASDTAAAQVTRMNDSAIQAMPPALLVEIETLRDQRDLYRSLLLSELDAAGQLA